MNKEKIRKIIKKRRISMSQKEVEYKSDIIVKNLIKLKEFKDSKNIMIFLSFNNEVNTFGLIEKTIKMGKKVIVPYTIKDKYEIVPTVLGNIEKDLVVSSYGYLEPKKEKIKPFPEENIDLTVVPGLAFDKKMSRIGFGKGYYDRYLVKIKKSAKKIAIAYEYQVLEEIPQDHYDVKMDVIVTEENIYKNAE